MKVATPAWLLDSATAGRLLPWTDYKYKAETKMEPSQGRKIPQKTLLDGFTSSSTSSKTQLSVVHSASPVNISRCSTRGPSQDVQISSQTNPRGADAATPLLDRTAIAPYDDHTNESIMGPLTIGDDSSYMDDDTYAASKFGGIGDFMKRKRKKLQIQNAQIGDVFDTAEGKKSAIFKGLSIYVSFSLGLVEMVWRYA
jgi:hypothetical protein